VVEGAGFGTEYLLSHGVQTDYAICADNSNFKMTWVSPGQVLLRITVYGLPGGAWATAHAKGRSTSQNAIVKMLPVIEALENWSAAYSERPGTPATRMADDVPAAEKRRRLNELLGVQERIGLERNRAWVGRETEVLVDTIVPPRSHDHDAEEAAGTTESRDAFAHLPDGIAHLAGRSREGKLVHVAGDPALVGELVRVRVEHGGPYALRGTLA